MSLDEPQIALAASPREWSLRLHRHVADHGGARVRVTALQPADVLDEDVDVFVADDTTSFLTPRLVAELQRRGTRVLGVYDDADPRSKGELVELGVDDVLERTCPPRDFVGAVQALAEPSRREERATAEAPGLTAGAAATGRAAVDAAGASATQAGARGRVVAVAAASGGSGATEVALALACLAGRGGRRPVLVDADEVAPAVAQRLGLDRYPNLRVAADAVEQRRGRVVSSLQWTDGGRLAVLAGLTSGRDWSQLRPPELLAVLERLSAEASDVVVNVGPLLEDLSGQGGPPRFGGTRAVLGAADVVVVVGTASPLGLARTLEWAAEARALAASTPVHVALNRAPRAAFKRGELVSELARTFPAAGIHLLPDDPRVAAAAWAGAPVGSGAFLRSVAPLADAVLSVVRPPSRGRRRRRPTAGAR